VVSVGMPETFGFRQSGLVRGLRPAVVLRGVGRGRSTPKPSAAVYMRIASNVQSSARLDPGLVDQCRRAIRAIEAAPTSTTR